MILPTKGISSNRALISLGARVLQMLSEPKTVSRVWDELQKAETPGSSITFDWFVLCLDLLFAIGAIDLDRGRLHQRTPGKRGTP
jgi:hypothetical protein